MTGLHMVGPYAVYFKSADMWLLIFIDICQVACPYMHSVPIKNSQFVYWS